MSLNSYSEAAPTDALSDIGIGADRGSANPFVAGNRRDLRQRGWRVTVLDEQPPERRARAPTPSTRGRQRGRAIEVVYRVYEPDRGLDLTGGTGLPRPELRLADGTRAAGRRRRAQQINDPNRGITVDTTPEVQWEPARSAAAAATRDTNPAYDPLRWERFFTYEYAALGGDRRLHRGGRAARHADDARGRGRQLLEPRLRLHLRPPAAASSAPVLVAARASCRARRAPATTSGSWAAGRCASGRCARASRA